MRGKLTKVSTNKNALRTQEVEGEFDNLPEIGKHFVIVGESLTPENNFRLVETSIVQEIVQDVAGDGAQGGQVKFRTEFSTYTLDELPDV